MSRTGSGKFRVQSQFALDLNGIVGRKRTVRDIPNAPDVIGAEGFRMSKVYAKATVFPAYGVRSKEILPAPPELPPNTDSPFIG